MPTMDELMMEALRALVDARWTITEAPGHVIPGRGLYAIHGAPDVWTELGLEHRPDTPLYVGKSESSLVDRELKGHFAIDPARPARTGGSTVRRSFAALLREPLALVAVPRNLERPERFANFALPPDGDQRLTAWMHANLTLSVWSLPEQLGLPQLRAIETSVIRTLMPPVNLRDNPVKMAALSEARAVMARQAAAWRPPAPS